MCKVKKRPQWCGITPCEKFPFYNAEKKQIMYKAGDFLYKLGNQGILKKSQRVFIYTGYTTGDGYGVLIGFDSDGKLCKSTGYANYQYGNDVRPATDEEIKEFINEIFNYQNPIREYGRP